ncbi:MAG: C-terminal binding protein [candidate division NC10 bacterium]|nr:C-terminal binding protein [candidate division NC10 bacterium]
MPLVVITDCDHENIAVEERIFGAAGIEVRLPQVQDEGEVIRAAREADAVLNQYAPMTARVLDGLPRLRIVSKYGVGYDTIDLAAATAHGIIVANVPDYCVEEVSDHAMALLLALWRGVAFYDRGVRSGTWNAEMKKPMVQLAGRVLGILGVGRIGSRVAQKALGLGMIVIGHDPYLAAWPAGVRAVSREELLHTADAVSLNVPLNAETRHLIGEAALRRMKPSASLVNTARGGVVDTVALERALREGWIAGAALDVVETEPLPAGSPLSALPNVIVTPHAAWYSQESVPELKRRAAENVLAALSGRRPPTPVNPEVFAGGKLRATTSLL